MILDNNEGFSKHKRLRQIFDYEIECSPLDSGFMDDIQTKLALYTQISEELSDNTVLKESEDHSIRIPYYELSVYCSKEEIDIMKIKLSQQGIVIAQVLENYVY